MSVLASCDKVSKNGDIDGMWQLQDVQGGLPGVSYVGETSDDMHYWSFHLGLVQYSRPDGDRIRRYYSHFSLIGDSLFLYDFCCASPNEKEEDNNEWVTPEKRSEIYEWGLNPIQDTRDKGRVSQSFHVDALDRNTMHLSSGATLLKFRKF